jgi:cytochrome c biogenesis protein CcdA
LTAGGRVLISLFPYWGLGVGAVLVVLGGFLLLTKRKIEVLALAGVQGPKSLKGVRAFFFFGIAYGLTSLSCTLPIFLVVVGSALAAGGFLVGLVQFVSYAIGMGSVMIILTLAVVLFKTEVSDRMFLVVPYMQQVGAILLIAVGLYLIHYWTFGVGGQELLFV